MFAKQHNLPHQVQHNLGNDEDYAWAAQQLAGIAREFAFSRLVSVLEGGYDCPALARSACAFVQALAEA